MQAELEQQLIEAVKGRNLSVDLTAEDAALVTVTTLRTMASFSAKNTAHDRARLFNYAGDAVEKLLTEG